VLKNLSNLAAAAAAAAADDDDEAVDYTRAERPHRNTSPELREPAESSIIGRSEGRWGGGGGGARGASIRSRPAAMMIWRRRRP
jgi:hypothetical protein